PAQLRPGHQAPHRSRGRDPAPRLRPGGPEHPLLPGTRFLRPARLHRMRPHARLPARPRRHPPDEAAPLTRPAIKGPPKVRTTMTSQPWPAKLPVRHVRIARPTDQLDEVVRFYREGLGLPELGRFAGHAGYLGVMLGLPGM